MMGLLPFYVKGHRNAISIADYNALFRAYCEFKLQECLERNRAAELGRPVWVGRTLKTIGA